MKICYPKDNEGNIIGFRTPEKYVYDTSGTSLSTKLAGFVGKTDYASTNNYGIIKVGDNLTINNGVLSAGTAASKDVPTSGNASATQVVMGNDTRLSDARTPTSHSHDAATTSAAGFMSTSDKSKLNGLPTNTNIFQLKNNGNMIENSDNSGFLGQAGWGKFGSGSSIGNIIDSDGAFLFIPWGTDSNSYGFILACNDDGNELYLGNLVGSDDDITWQRIWHDNYHPGSGGGNALPLSGGTITGQISKDSGGAWISGRDNAIIRTLRTSGEGSDWHPAIAVKTSSGCWTFGSVGGETLQLSYDTDSNYSTGNNTSAVINFPTAGKTGTIALLDDTVAKAYTIVDRNNNSSPIGARYGGPGVSPTGWGCMFGTEDGETRILPVAATDGATGNTLVFRTSQGYIYATYFNASCGDESSYFDASS